MWGLVGDWCAWGAASNRGQEAPLDILKQRYARGEIEREEFERKRRDLGG